jgi:hypothetical protein
LLLVLQGDEAVFDGVEALERFFDGLKEGGREGGRGMFGERW